MDRETARQEVRRNWRVILADISMPARQRVNGEQSYICPLCNNGSGDSGDGITRNPRSKDGNGLKCFKCGFSGDIIDLYTQYVPGYDFNTSLAELAEYYLHETIDAGRPERTTEPAKKSDGGAILYDYNGEPLRKATSNPPELSQNPPTVAEATTVKPREQNATQGRTEGERGNPDYTEYYRECRKRLEDPRAISYLSARGISEATAAAYYIGFDPEFRSRAAVERAKEAGKNPPPATPRIIIPTSKESYIAREINPAAKIRYLNEGTPGIFNEKALFTQEVKAVFITEGAFDALSFLEAGFPAAALNSAANAQAFIDKLEKRKPKAKIILCMDGDEAGKKAAANLAAGLNRMNIPFTMADKAILNGHKDANEALVADREAFVDAVTRQRELTARPDGVANYITGIMGDDMARFRSEIKTGYRNLDDISGGLYPGLYVLGAISSLGKTTFIHQMADQMAANGQDVIFFSLEQSRLELVSKSIARTTAQADITRGVTSLAIRKGCRQKNVMEATREYMAKTGNRLSIVEQNMDGGVTYITNYIRQYIQDNETAPVVIIDYLQILQREKTDTGREQTIREVVDGAVTALKRLSRELTITIIVISSFNRSNYLSTVDFESFKESGGIEYTADVVYGMQLQCMNDELFTQEKKLNNKREAVKAAKAADPRHVELVCLKNRYGKANFSCYFDYFPTFDLFIPARATPGNAQSETKRAAVRTVRRW